MRPWSLRKPGDPLVRLKRPRILRGAAVEVPYAATELKTSRLALRPHRLDDANAWYALQSHPGVRQFLAWPDRTWSEARAHLRGRTRLRQVHDFLALAVTRRGELIGDISLHLRATAASVRTVEVGWIIHPRHSGCGYATEAAAAVLLDVFDRLDAKMAVAVVKTGNERSVALGAALGFIEAHRDDASVILSVSRPALRDRIARDERRRNSLVPHAAGCGVDRWSWATRPPRRMRASWR